MEYLSAAEARAFAERWLPAWTGNDPARLAAFYSEDTFYLDPAVPEGIRGRPALQAHFRKLLARFPDWVWSQVEGIPMEAGFLNKWHARIPVGRTTIEVTGVCLVQLDADGRIRRNEVYFDRAELLSEMARRRDEDGAPAAG